MQREGDPVELGFAQESLPFSSQVHNEQGFALRLESKASPLCLTDLHKYC